MKCKLRGSANKAGREPNVSKALHQLKERLLDERLAEVSDPELRRSLFLAANESVALAWTTAYPLLVLPELMAEHGRVTEKRHDRQNCIRERSRSKLSAAA